VAHSPPRATAKAAQKATSTKNAPNGERAAKTEEATADG
jgi:hypothetical protein